MGKYLVKRIATFVVMFFGVTFVLYALTTLIGNYADMKIMNAITQNGAITPDQEQAILSAYGLDKPLLVRYFNWFASLFDGTWGYSYENLSVTVFSQIQDKIGYTLRLMFGGFALGLVLAIPLGIISAIKPKGFVDYISNLFVLIGNSIPGFIIALLLIYVFCANLNWLPSMYSATSRYSMTKQMLLPTICVSIGVVGPILKQVRGAMLDNGQAEYIKTARIKGLRESTVVLRHMFRNAIIPVVTSVGLAVPSLVGGSVVIEKIFSLPGIGKMLVESISTPCNTPVVMGIVTIQLLTVLVVNLVLDILYTILDPRIRY